MVLELNAVKCDAHNCVMRASVMCVHNYVMRASVMCVHNYVMRMRPREGVFFGLTNELV